jgi:hypothetical protein
MRTHLETLGLLEGETLFFGDILEVDVKALLEKR